MFLWDSFPLLGSRGIAIIGYFWWRGFCTILVQSHTAPPFSSYLSLKDWILSVSAMFASSRGQLINCTNSNCQFSVHLCLCGKCACLLCSDWQGNWVVTCLCISSQYTAEATLFLKVFTLHLSLMSKAMDYNLSRTTQVIRELLLCLW